MVDVTQHRGLLREGTNVLAIHALNAQKDDPDMFFSTRLVAGKPEQPIALTESAVINVCVFLDGEWSPIAEREFRVSSPASRDDVRISEVHYHPRQPSAAEIAAGIIDGDEFEFLEIVNVSDHAIDLSLVRLSMQTTEMGEEGVEFDFADSAIRELSPGARVVVVENQEAFVLRYGP